MWFLSCTSPWLFLHCLSSPCLESLIMSRLILTVRELWRGVWWLRQLFSSEVSVVTMLLPPEYVQIVTRKCQWYFWGVVIGIRVSEVNNWMTSLYCIVLWQHYLSTARRFCTWRCCSGFGIWRSWANIHAYTHLEGFLSGMLKFRFHRCDIKTSAGVW